MPQPHSAGILLFREIPGAIEVLLVHPGGPFWRNKDAGAWMIPKGAIEPGEQAADAAVREFAEETGGQLGSIPFPLCTIRQKAGKIVHVFAAEGEFDPATLTSLEFEMIWPPGAEAASRFPEVDSARWMTLAEAREFILPSQEPILDALEAKLRGEATP